MRLDKYLYLKNFTTSRNRANELIINKKVQVNDKIITKPSFQILSDVEIKILEDVIYVSRGAYKLKSFIDSHKLSIDGKKRLDIGSSTGGFVQVLCQYGAKSVSGVDVGRDQLHKTVKDNPKVLSYEETDIRDFQSDCCFDFVTCDLSFIGIAHVLKEIDRLSCGEILILFKPQFEVGRNVKRDKKGVVKDSKAIILAQEGFEQLIKALRWRTLIKDKCCVKGKEGNEEIFYYFKK